MWYRLLQCMILFTLILYPIHTSKSAEPVKSINSFKDEFNQITIIVSEPSPIKNEIQVQSLVNSKEFFEPIIETDPKKLKVKKVKTTISEEELKKILRESHLDIFNKPASEHRIHMAWAQIAFENGRGTKVYNYNLGNVGGNPDKPIRHYYTVSGYRFRSFQNFKDGARCYWQILKERCSGSLKFFDSGDPYTASLYLRRCGYYRADIEHYSKNLSALYFESYKKSVKE